MRKIRLIENTNSQRNRYYADKERIAAYKNLPGYAKVLKSNFN
jgi:hypothetical protein